MATPVIDSITANPATVVPGGAVVITMVGHDADSAPQTFVGTLTDAAGHQATASVVIPVNDPLTFGLTGPVGAVIVPRAGSPGVFDCRVA